MADIKVESFDVDVTTDGSTHTLSNDVGSVNSAFLRINSGVRNSSGGLTTSTGNTAPNQGNIGVHLSATDEITFERLGTTSAKIVGEVWRYTGAAGAEHEFIVRGRVAITLTGTSASAAISGIVDEDKCVPFITGLTTNTSSTSGWDEGTVAAHMDGSGNVVVSRNNSGATCVVYVDVVEFTGSAWSVGHGISSSHDTAAETVTLNTDSTGAGGSTFDVGDWATAFIEATMEGDTSETGLADTLALARPAAATTQVVFDLHSGDANARNDGDAYIHVVQNDDLIVSRNSLDNIAEGNGTYGTVAWPSGASTARNLEDLALEWYCTTSGTGTAHMRGSLATRITAASGTITHWVHRSGNTVDVDYGVIDMSQLVGTAPASGSVSGLGAYRLGLDEFGFANPQLFISTDDSAHSHASDSSTIQTASDMGAQEALHAHTADSPTVSVASAVTTDDSTNAHTAESVSVQTASDIGAVEATHGHSADSVTISVGSSVSADDSTHSHGAESAAIATASDMAAVEATHGHTADSVTITVATQAVINPDDSTNAHTGEAVSVQTASDVGAVETSHAHTADSPTVSVASSVTADSSDHAHNADAVGIATASDLTSVEATHSHTADAVVVTVTTGSNMTAVSSQHAHVAEAAAISVASALAANEAVHGMSSDEPTVYPSIMAPSPTGVVITTDGIVMYKLQNGIEIIL